jgi:L-aminopeptidase/D-esterase-like protein
MSVNETLTAVPGVRVGHWTDAEAHTGVTVISFPEPNVAAAEVRGAAPGTRELGLLAPGMKVEMIQALVFAGGSAFGLAAADGVVRALERDERGHQTGSGLRVPIVPAAIVFDLAAVHGSRPGPEAGEAAYLAATEAPVVTGSVGAGTGATVAKWRGFEHARKGGVGSAARTVGKATVGVLAVVNAVGDVFDLDGTPLTGGSPVPEIMPMALPSRVCDLANTTLIAVATDARLARTDLMRLTIRAHDALAACVRPGHTRYDGDIAYAVSCGEVAADLDALGEAAFVATAAAIVGAVRLAGPLEPLTRARERVAGEERNR